MAERARAATCSVTLAGADIVGREATVLVGFEAHLVALIGQGRHELLLLLVLAALLQRDGVGEVIIVVDQVLQARYLLRLVPESAA